MGEPMTDESDALAAKAARERRYDLRTPIIRQIYDVAQAIEACGASEKLTHAVTLCGELYEPVRVLLEECDALTAELAQARAQPCPHVVTSDEGTSHCNLAEASVIALKAELAQAREEVQRRDDWMERRGYRRCDIPACNCNGWHGGHAQERLSEIDDALREFGIDMNGRTLLDGVRAATARAEALHKALRECSEYLHDATEDDHEAMRLAKLCRELLK